MDKSFGLSPLEIEKIKEVFSRYVQVQKVIIFGSRATGNQKPSSDIDFTLMGENIGLSQVYAIENDLDELLLPFNIDICIYHQIKDENFLNHINQHGVVFFERNG